jgi:Cu+-exporting ATPase
MAVESNSEHPTAIAIKEYAVARGVQPRHVVKFQNLIGFGVSGMVKDGGGCFVEVRISREPSDITGNNFKMPDTKSSFSRSYVYLDNVFSAMILVGDALRPSAREAVAKLKQCSANVEVLSGDRADVTAHIADEAGIGMSRGGLSPVQKVSAATNAQKEGKHVCMVGDGVNDAAALAAADVGVSLGSSTSLARSSSNITILDSDLRKLPWIIEYGRRIRRTITWNFIWVFLYNTIGIGLAITGQIRPVLAALAMVVSSVLVILNSSRLAKQGR